jgi:uncharacterized membrane protein YeaQ/YmgE (transglycosylase-associated protein family)
MPKESKLKNILLECSAGLVGSVAGGVLAHFVYTPGALDITQKKYTFLGTIAGGIIGSYLCYTHRYDTQQRKDDNSSEKLE